MGDLMIEPDGSFSLGPYAPGGYDLAVVGPGGTIGLVRGIEVALDRPAGGVEVALAQGAALRIRYDGVEPYAQLAVFGDGVRVKADGLRSGTEIAVTVPCDRPVRVELRDRAGRSAERTLSVARGGSELVELRLE
jgi:hypothetical protein